MLNAIIMDFDGLIVDTEFVWYNIYVDWFKKNKGYNLSMEEFLRCVGSSSEDLFQSFEKEYNWIINRDEFTQDTQSLFIERSNLLPPKEGVVEFIQTAKKMGLKLALATSATRLKPITHLKRLDLLDYFDVIVTAENVARIKPFPDLFLKAAEELGVDAHEALVVEDSRNGLISGQKAGMRVLVVPNEVTKYSDFQGYYQKVDSLKKVNIEKMISEF